ncbi:hypothetical protein PybrP1_011959 [[Pythium] brassicae (nom. inval.)]|nr:hypothetical protein PybrP1_011959 [[Pythium] brassicae (nom. inval.)]
MRPHIVFCFFLGVVAMAAIDPLDTMPTNTLTRHSHSGHLHQHDRHDHDHNEPQTPLSLGSRDCERIWDMELFRVDESAMEEGMDDQGYRQHV